MVNKRYTNKFIELVSNKSTATSMRENVIDKYVNATTSIVYSIHKQHYSSNRILEKAKLRMFHFKNLGVK